MQRKRCIPLAGGPDQVRRRVAYRFIQFYYRVRPEDFANFPPSAVLELSEKFKNIYPFLYPELAWYARNMAAGFKLKELRDSGWRYENRALTKRKPKGPKRFD